MWYQACIQEANLFNPRKCETNANENEKTNHDLDTITKWPRIVCVVESRYVFAIVVISLGSFLQSGKVANLHCTR
jgi:hypothetical protein